MGFVLVHADFFLHIVTQRKQHRPGIASNDNKIHVPTARSSADLTTQTHTPTRHTLAKDRIILRIATPQAASSQRTYVSRTQGRGRTHPFNRRVTDQYLHTQSVTTRRRCGCNDKHEAPREPIKWRAKCHSVWGGGGRGVEEAAEVGAVVRRLTPGRGGFGGSP